MRILAALERGISTRPVLELAELLARHLDVPFEVLRVGATRPLEDVMAQIDEPETLLTVIDARHGASGAQPVGPVTGDIIGRAAKPVIVLPSSGAADVPTRPRRLLVPLDATEDAARAAARAVDLFAGPGIDVVALHVFDAGTVPRFLDRAEHDLGPWAHEFLARCGGALGARMDLRTGRASDQVVAATAGGAVDLLALGWSRDLSEGRAAVVRGSLARSCVPVLLIPILRTPVLAPPKTEAWGTEVEGPSALSRG